MARIPDLLTDTEAAALRLKQPLTPMEGWEIPIFPATYPPEPNRKTHRHDTPYTVNQLKDGRWVATLDTVQSQANRMEATFTEERADAVPRVTITAGERTVPLTELPHRLADAAIRTSNLQAEIREVFEAMDAGDPLLVAQLAPTSLVYGAWDSRDTRVKIPRMIRSEIYAWDVDVFTRSAQFTGTFFPEELEFTDQEWRKGAKVGFAPTPSVDQHGGVMVHGAIQQIATLHLCECRKRERACPGLGQYILGLALTGLWHGGREYDLRTGCWLVPDSTPGLEVISRDGRREAIELGAEDIERFLAETALPAARELGIRPGETVREAQYDPKAGKKLAKEGAEE